MFFLPKGHWKSSPPKILWEWNGFLVSGGFAVHGSVRCSHLNLIQNAGSSIYICKRIMLALLYSLNIYILLILTNHYMRPLSWLKQPCNHDFMFFHLENMVATSRCFFRMLSTLPGCAGEGWKKRGRPKAQIERMIKSEGPKRSPDETGSCVPTNLL